jgi:MATE family multidrug resistance protein
MNRNELTEKLIQKDSKVSELQIPSISFWKACLDLILDATPAIFGLLFIFLCETINIAFIGRYNDRDLISAIGIGTLLMNSTGFTIGLGLMGGLDTLCSQAYGAKEYRIVGIFANIARMTILLFFLCVSIPCIIFSKHLLLLIGQNEQIADIASRFCHSMIPSVFFALQFQCNLRYLQAMNIFTPGMFITLCTTILHLLWCHLFIHHFMLDVVGAGLAMSLTQFTNYISVTLYIQLRNPVPGSYFFINKDCFNPKLIFEYLKKAIPAAILLASDTAGLEIMTLLSSYISILSLSANVCFFNLLTQLWMMSLGIAFATTTLVGNSIGEGNVRKAKMYCWAALSVDFVVISLVSLLIFFFEYDIPYIYTNDDKIASLVTSVIQLYLVFSITDAFGIILNGVVKGLGMQKWASIAALIVYYPLNIPLACILAFYLNYGIFGLWYATCFSMILMMIFYMSFLTYVDWQEISDHILAKLEKEKKDIKRNDNLLDFQTKV